jgi:hypothetical protein
LDARNYGGGINISGRRLDGPEDSSLDVDDDNNDDDNDDLINATLCYLLEDYRLIM